MVCNTEQTKYRRYIYTVLAAYTQEQQIRHSTYAAAAGGLNFRTLLWWRALWYMWSTSSFLNSYAFGIVNARSTTAYRTTGLMSLCMHRCATDSI